MQRVEADSEAMQTGFVESPARDSARRTPLVVNARSSMRGLAGKTLDQDREIAAEQWLATSQPNLVHALVRGRRLRASQSPRTATHPGRGSQT